MSSSEDEVTQPSASAPATVPDPPPTDPRGLPLAGADEPGVRDLIVAFRSDWETRKTEDDAWKGSVSGLLRGFDSRIGGIESDVRQLRADVATAKATAEGARSKADTAHTMAQTASVAAGRASQDNEAERENLLAALASTRGELQAATAAIGTLRSTDDELKAMVQEAAKDSAGAAIRDVVGKNPKLVAGVAAVLIVLAQVLSQRFLVPPAAPNQGALPAPTPTVHVDQKESQ